MLHFCCDIAVSDRNELILWIKTWLFVIKFEDIFEKKVCVIVVFPCSILFAKMHKTWNSRFCFHWMILQIKFEWKRRCLRIMWV